MVSASTPISSFAVADSPVLLNLDPAERIREIFDSCATGPWPDPDSTTSRRAASSRPVSQLGRSPSSQPLTSAPGTPTWLKNQRMGNLQQIYLNSGPIPGAVDLSRATQYGSTDRQPTRTPRHASFSVSHGYKVPTPPESSPAAREPKKQPSYYPFPPTPTASPPISFSPTTAAGPASPFGEDGPPPPLPSPHQAPTPPHLSISHAQASVPSIALLSPSRAPSQSSRAPSASTSDDHSHDRHRRMSSRTFGRNTPSDGHGHVDADDDSPLPAPPTRGKWSTASTAATGEDSDGASSIESHGRVREVSGRGKVVRSTSRVLFKGRLKDGDGERYPRSSTEPKKERRRPSSLLVPESERAGRRSITLET